MNGNRSHDRQRPPLKGASLRRLHGRRQVLIRTTGIAAAIIALTVTANITMPWISAVGANGQMQSGDAQDRRVGTIEVQSGQDRCDLLKFDNATGRRINASMSCHSDVMLDARGVPVPMGTVHRLDSISKSFLGHGR
jgi:hypothetical protein